MRITEADRIAARAERDDKRKMSAKAVARLREKAEDRLRREVANEKFISDFYRLRKDDWTLRRLLERISRPVREPYMTPQEIDSFYNRRALKLRRSLANGWNPNSVEDVQFLSELTPAETAMSEDQFYDALTRGWPRSEAVVPATEKGTAKPVARRIRRTCVECGRRFLAYRTDARYCSPGCRNKASYKRGRRGNPKGWLQIPDPNSVTDTLREKSAFQPIHLQGHPGHLSPM